MKTVIIYGSARTNGHTKALVDAFSQRSEGDVVFIDCYRVQNLNPCKDCRYCWHVRGCCIQDDMQTIYHHIDSADVLVLASPVYFHSVTGVMKILLDRLQLYWAGVRRGDHHNYSAKKGVIVMTGGAPSFQNQFLAGEMVLKGILGDVNATCEGVITMPNTDYIGAEGKQIYLNQAAQLAEKIYGGL